MVKFTLVNSANVRLFVFDLKGTLLETLNDNLIHLQSRNPLRRIAANPYTQL